MIKNINKVIFLSVLVLSPIMANTNTTVNAKSIEIKVNQSPLKWLSFREAFNKHSKGSKKPLFVMVGSTTCKFCPKYKSAIEKDLEFRNLLNNFEVVYISQDKDFIPVQLLVPATPSFWITDSEGNQYNNNPIVGLNPSEMIESIKDILKYQVNK